MILASRPSELPNLVSYRGVAKRDWTEPTGGSLLGTIALSLLVGGLSGSAVLAFLMFAGTLGVHLHLRRTR
jgi:hypothetical protein